ncbi:hypothetical protein Ddye_017263 [Dipteronia dyeriana]|uniref:HAT C-terminal dimerisation domain-containing protein n=1 Tax=Dipteronia dyeriana TaxID=168575 RepID=A0AAD9U987_9ROSI|nr:hypothetical protein Ddye_017263 [Dipteronia dyeriana]
MASGSGSGVRDIPPRHSVSRTGKGRMSKPDPVQLDNIGFDDTTYHEFLQRQAYLESLNYPINSNPPLIISEPNSSQPIAPSPSPSPGNMTSQSENIPDFAADPNFEEPAEKDKKHLKYDLFVLHIKKVTKPNGTCWAREHEKHFPISSIIAKQILATPVSTVAVEQEFSMSGNILDARRSLLSPESIQVQVCVDDLTKAGYRQQEMEPGVIYDFFDDDHTTDTGTDGSD